MVVRLVIAAALLFAGSAGLAAQARGAAPASPATPAGHAAPATTGKSPGTKDKAPAQDAHAPAAETHTADTHAADTGAGAAEAHAGGHDAAKDKPKPKVSSVAARPQPAPAAAGAHAAVGHTATGYVATGSKKVAPGKKSKPVVSAGAVPGQAPKAGEAGHDTHAAPDAESAAPHAAEPPVVTGAAGSPAPDGAPVAGSSPRKPVKLSDVHERLTSALAGFHADAHVVTSPDQDGHVDGRAKAHGVSAPRRGGGPGSSATRVAVQWPGPRWTVAWPGPPRLTLTWPDAPAKPAAGRQADPH